MKRIFAILLSVVVFVCGSVVHAADTHIVERGDYLIKIAKEYDLDWRAVMLANETHLRDLYESRCSLLKKRYTKSKARKGHYCLDRADRPRPWANSLKPGDVLTIPAKEISPTVDDVVRLAAGKRVALVIDDTGSMDDDRRRVSQMYLAALKKYSKDLIGVWLYADGEVRQYKGHGVQLSTTGRYENTHAALREAAKQHPDYIVLVTDEAGDDWDWGTVASLPRVIAHCLAASECGRSLGELVRLTNGQYQE